VKLKTEHEILLTLLFASSIVLTSCKETEAQNSNTKNVVPFTEVGNQMKNEAIANQAQQPTNNKFNKCNHNYCYSSRWKNPHMDNHHIVAIFP
jgi:hypothetical protein